MGGITDVLVALIFLILVAAISCGFPSGEMRVIVFFVWSFRRPIIDLPFVSSITFTLNPSAISMLGSTKERSR